MCSIMINLTPIGDCHGNVEAYKEICFYAPGKTIQLGDFGFKHQWAKLNDWNLSPKDNKILRGNHDDPHAAILSPYDLGDYGTIDFGQETQMFFVRGAMSRDKVHRVEGIDWWPEEELSWMQMQHALNMYEEVKPEIMFTHDFPMSCLEAMFNHAWLDKSRTTQFLDGLLAIHRPKWWFGGHHHENRDIVIDGTRFICLDELSTFNFEVE